MIDPVRRGIDSDDGLWKALRRGDLLPDNEGPLLFKVAIRPWWTEEQVPPTPHSIFIEFLSVWEALQQRGVAENIPGGEPCTFAAIIEQGINLLDECISEAEDLLRVLGQGQQRVLEYNDELGKIHGSTKMTQRTFIDVLKGLPDSDGRE